MLPLDLFKRRNFAVGNVETFAMYGGLGITFFLLVLFLQGVAGFSALEAGSASVPVTLVMFALSMRFGRLADAYGPRWFMGSGPLISAVGLVLMLRLDADVSYWADLLPALLVFALGLSLTVAPLTATVLADADEHNAGIASAVNNAIARVAGLVAIAAIGAMVASQYDERLDSRLGPLATASGARRRGRGGARAAVQRRAAGGRGPGGGGAADAGRARGVGGVVPLRRRHRGRPGRPRRGCWAWPASATRAGGCRRATARAGSSSARRATPRGSRRASGIAHREALTS